MENGNYYLGLRFSVELNDLIDLSSICYSPPTSKTLHALNPEPYVHRAASAASAASARAFACRRVSTGNSSGGSGLRGFRVLQMPGVLRSFKEAYVDLQKPRDIVRDFHELVHRPLSPLRGNQLLPLTQTVLNLGLTITGTGSSN